MADRRQMDPEMAAASRRAAALFMHWRRKNSGSIGEATILREMGDDLGQWTALVCALLNLSEGMVKAARDGREDAYLAYVLRQASLDEVAGHA